MYAKMSLYDILLSCFYDREKLCFLEPLLYNHSVYVIEYYFPNHTSKTILPVCLIFTVTFNL